MRRDCVCLNTTSKTASKWIVKEPQCDMTLIAHSGYWWLGRAPLCSRTRSRANTSCALSISVRDWFDTGAVDPILRLQGGSDAFLIQLHPSAHKDTHVHTHTHTVMYRRNSVMSVIVDSLHCFSLVSHNHLGHSAVEEIHSSKLRTSLVH